MEQETTSNNKKRQGQSKERMLEVSKMGVEARQMSGQIKAYEKAQKRKEMEQKFAMLQAKIAKQEKQDQAAAPPPLPFYSLQSWQLAV